LPIFETLSLHAIDIARGAGLEAGCVSVVELLERMALPPGVSALANPKSSTGRLDVFTRLIADRAREFDKSPQAYRGPLYAEISPRTFSILARTGSRLSQLRFRRGTPDQSDTMIRQLHEREALVTSGAPALD